MKLQCAGGGHFAEKSFARRADIADGDANAYADADARL